MPLFSSILLFLGATHSTFLESWTCQRNSCENPSGAFDNNSSTFQICLNKLYWLCYIFVTYYYFSCKTYPHFQKDSTSYISNFQLPSFSYIFLDAHWFICRKCLHVRVQKISYCKWRKFSTGGGLALRRKRTISQAVSQLSSCSDLSYCSTWKGYIWLRLILCQCIHSISC